MREHQIVITLKPDQFLEVQRMARAANAKSMGIFVRQKLLAALGIEGAAAGDAADGAQSQNVEEVVGQIRRLHSELKTFVAESLSVYDMEIIVQSGGTEHDAGSLATQAQTLPEPVLPQDDPLENVAHKTFAISPRLGAIGQQTSDTTAGGRSGAPDASGMQPADTARRADSTARHETHRRDQHHYYHPRAGSETMDVPFKPSTEHKKPQPVIQDPLDKLLPNEDEFKPVTARTAEADDDDYETDEMAGEYRLPASLAERRRQLASQAIGTQPLEQPQPVYEPQPVYQAPAQYTGDLDAPMEAPMPGVAPTAEQTVYVDAATVLNEQQNDVGGSSSTTPETGSEDENLKPGTGKPLGYPSLSGSPPPKRRQV